MDTHIAWQYRIYITMGIVGHLRPVFRHIFLVENSHFQDFEAMDCLLALESQILYTSQFRAT